MTSAERVNDQPPSDHTDLDVTLLSERDVRERLGDRPLTLRLLRPPFAALGVGTLRVLRVSVGDERTEIVAGYDRYERVSA